MSKQHSTTYSRLHERLRKPKHDPIYAELIRKFNALDAIPQAKRTAAQRQEHEQLRARIDEIEQRMALAEVRG